MTVDTEYILQKYTHRIEQPKHRKAQNRIRE